MLWGSVCFSYLEDKVYCEVNGNYVQVFLTHKDAYKCSDYVQTLESAIQAIYQSVWKIQKYIFAWHDVIYWTDLKDQQQQKIEEFQLVRANILYHVEIFEHNLFEKAKQYMAVRLEPYQCDLELQLQKLESVSLESLTWERLEEYNEVLSFVQRQIKIVALILAASDLEELFGYVPTYFYLKKQIAWTSE